MTIDEVAEIGKLCLIECEGRLTVTGIKGYERGTTKEIAKSKKCDLSALRSDDVRPLILSVLQTLAEVGEFMMSEPKYTIPSSEIRNVEQGDLRLTVSYGWSKQDLTSFLWVSCWCYPAIW
jgi:hypothetical protein